MAIPKSTGLKILLYDIESSPNLGFVWDRYEQNVLGDFVKERQVISVAWKWLGEDEVHCIAMPMLKGYKRFPDKNKELVVAFHKIISSADIVVGHNIDEFDDKMMNAEFLFHKLKPPPPHKTVDTLKVVRSKFRFNSNKLGDLGKHLGFGEKVETGGFSLWAGCLRGDMKCWDRMIEYNKKDVILLEKIYLLVRPWMASHQNVNVADRHVGCPVCRSVNMRKQGWRLTPGGRHLRYQCQDCGKWSHGKIEQTKVALEYK